ncbi:MAG: wax ester/triacylglycerol synthase family O-acyltransferase [Alphaproteobacteria bacterium]
MQPVTGFDATWLYLETEETPMHIGALFLVRLPASLKKQGPGAFQHAMTQKVAARLHLTPMLRRKLKNTPFDLDQPVWLEDKNFSIDNHVFQHNLTEADTPAGLIDAFALVENLHAAPLSRERPLWEIHIIDGLEKGCAALYVKLHQAVTDGDGGQSTLRSILDFSVRPGKLPDTMDDWVGEDDPGFFEAVSRVTQSLIDKPAKTAAAIPSIARAALRMGRAAIERTEQFANLMGPKSLFNQSVTSQRSIAVVKLDLGDIKAISDKADVTVTDVILAAAGGATREYLLAENALPAKTLTALAPYSTRDKESGEVEDRVTTILAKLATDIDDPVERLAAVALSTTKARAEVEEADTAPIDPYSILGAPAFLRALSGAFGKLDPSSPARPLLGNLMVSNIAGVAKPLYAAGAKIEANWPLPMLLPGQALAIAAQSYCDQLHVTVLACADALPEPERLTAGFEDEIAALAEAYGVKLKAVA